MEDCRETEMDWVKGRMVGGDPQFVFGDCAVAICDNGWNGHEVLFFKRNPDGVAPEWVIQDRQAIPPRLPAPANHSGYAVPA